MKLKMPIISWPKKIMPKIPLKNFNKTIFSRNAPKQPVKLTTNMVTPMPTISKTGSIGMPASWSRFSKKPFTCQAQPPMAINSIDRIQKRVLQMNKKYFEQVETSGWYWPIFVFDF